MEWYSNLRGSPTYLVGLLGWTPQLSLSLFSLELWSSYIVHTQPLLTPEFHLLSAFNPRGGRRGGGVLRKPPETYIHYDSETEHRENSDQSKVGGEHKTRTIPSRADQIPSLQGMTAWNMPPMVKMLSYFFENIENIVCNANMISVF